MTQPGGRRVFGRESLPEASRMAAILRNETVGGVLLLAATAPGR